MRRFNRLMQRLSNSAFAVLAVGSTFAMSMSGANAQSVDSDKATKHYTIGYVAPALSITLYQTLEDVLQKAAKANGDTVATYDPNNDPNTQSQQIDTMVAKKVDAIIVIAVDPNAVLPAIQRAKKAGIKIIALNRDLANGALRDVFVGLDYVKVGQQLTEYMCAAQQTPRLALILGPVTASYTIDMHKGINLAMAEGVCSKAKIVYQTNLTAITAQESLAATQNAITRASDVNGFYVAVDQLLPGVFSGMAGAGRNPNSATIVSQNGDPGTLGWMKQGKLHFDLAYRPHKVGTMIYQIARDLASGKSVPPVVHIEPLGFSPAPIQSLSFTQQNANGLKDSDLE
jgi:ABC-type sugar transport system substrate-binding protein